MALNAAWGVTDQVQRESLPSLDGQLIEPSLGDPPELGHLKAVHRPWLDPKAPSLTLADAKDRRHFSNRKSIGKQGCRPLEDGSDKIARTPADTIAFIAGESLQARLERDGSSTIHSIAQFLEMDFEPRALFGRIIFRPM